MSIVPTIRVTFLQGGHNGFINVSDFNPNVHELYIDPEVITAAKVVEKQILRAEAASAVDVSATIVDEEEKAAEKQIAEEKAARRAASLAKAHAANKAKREAAKAAKAAEAEKPKEE
jgi:hypothetical protein